MRSRTFWAALFFLLIASAARAAETEVQYLSGLGKDDPVKWEFKCDKGQNAGKWSTIGVPSNWELQGFGIYTYGRIKPESGWPRVHGIYKRTFKTPSKWRDETVFIRFEGVMTDSQVTINGQSAGAAHQGGYYAFKYDISRLLKPAGQQNEIQVDVDDDSQNESVNHAERRGDFWNYGGIFRPVYLEAVPRRFIDRLAIKATAAGSLSVDVQVANSVEAASNAEVTAKPNADVHAASALSGSRSTATDSPRASLEMQVLDRNGKAVGAPITVNDIAVNQMAHLAGNLVQPQLWTAETPNLYQLEVRLKLGNVVVHTVRQKFGFRTIELRPGQGLFVNCSRVFLKGVARHSFWPDSGRALSAQISRDDINVIKDLNGNAVRSSHYPPDRHFLDACDELGLYVLDELAGWQAKYDTDIGKKLVREMVEHDVNHPSILFWDSGNEGGFNRDLDGEYPKYDPQKRVVLHPWAAYPPGIADTKHYPNYETLRQKLAADPVFFPTEMLHGLYDGGGGAGLSDYWDAIVNSKAGAGGFIWAFLDEDVKRTDKGGILDSQGNYAPDGIVGPYREREPSFYTIKQLWSPILVLPPNEASHSYTVTNRYAFLNADQCTFEWQAIAYRRPNDLASGSIVLASRIDQGRSLPPGKSASWDGWGPPSALPQKTNQTPDATRLLIKDGSGRLLQTYVWPQYDLDRRVDQTYGAKEDKKVEPIQQIRQGDGVKKKDHEGAAPVAVTDFDSILIATAGDLSFRISKTTGMLISASRSGKPFSLANGPRVLAMGHPMLAPAPPLPALAPDSRLTSLTHKIDAEDLVVSATFDGPMRSLIYRLQPSGWLSIDYAYTLNGPQEYFGIGFDYPERKVEGMRFLGEGPGPVYQNRRAGGTLDVWNRPHNDTVVGDPDNLKPGERFDYPVFQGFYSGVRWLQLNTTEGPITTMVDQHPGSPVYVQIFTPKAPPPSLAGLTAVPFPTAGISFLHAIPAVGNKFGGPQTMGPSGQPTIARGEYKGHISLYFGELAAGDRQ